jgi:MFS family permease
VLRLPPALRHRDFGFFWLGFLGSGIGSQFTTVAMAWQIYQITNSPLQLGLLGLARAIPQMAVTVLGGVLADRRDRRQIMMVCQVAQFCVSSSLVVLTVSGQVTPVTLYLASILLALCTAIESPARQAIIPNLVPTEDLTSALALNATQRNIGSIVGPALAGIVLAAIGPQVCYGVDALSWLVMLAALFAIRTRALPLQVGRSSTLAAIGEGLAFVWAHPVILSCMVLDFGATFFGSARALYPIYARDILRVGASGLGLLYTAEAAGSMTAAIVMSTRSQIRRAGLWTLIGVAVYGSCAALFALSHVF